MTRIPERNQWFVALLLLVPMIAPAASENFKFGVDAGIGETDNVTLVESNKVSQTLAIADVDFSFKNKGSRLEEDAVGNLTYIDFLQHAYGNELLGRLNGLVRYALIPQRLTWTLEDNWSQTQLSPFEPLVPTNRQNVNYLTTGPEWYERFGGTGFMDVNARYSRASYAVSPIDSNRLLGTLQLGRYMSAVSSISLNGSVERVLFKNTGINTDYDLVSSFVRYELHGARTDVSLNAGVDRVSFGARSTSGFMTQLELTRKLSPFSEATLTAGRQLTDTSAAFNALQNGMATQPLNGVSTVGNTLNSAAAPFSSGVYTSSYLAALWQYNRDRSSLVISARREKDSYVNQPQFNGDINRFSVSLERKLTQVLSAQIFGNISQLHYDHDQFNLASTGTYSHRDGLYGLALTLREGRSLEFRFRYDHVARDVGAGAGARYGENRVLLTVGYRPQ